MMTDDDERYGKFTEEYKFTESCENLVHARNGVYQALLSASASLLSWEGPGYEANF